MEKPKCHNYYLLFALLIFVHSVIAQYDDQSGFISIDCGLPENTTQTEESTEIKYISDAAFVSSGVIGTILPEYRGNYQTQIVTLRSFPEGIRNCFDIGVAKGTKYLIRTYFVYGNYDNLNQIPSFDIYIGANFWATVVLKTVSSVNIKEIIYTPSRDNLHLCLVNIGSGTPFIQSIELRALKNTTYEISDSLALSMFVRLDFGSTTNSTYRFPNDPYDRAWTSFYDEEWTQLSTTLTVDPESHIDFWPPNIVMKNAAVPKNENASIDFYLTPPNVTEKYYIYAHFAELQKLEADEFRAFNLTLNGKILYSKPIIPEYLTSNTIYSTKALATQSNYSFSIVKLENSTLPPIINAMEFYTELDFSKSESNEDDVNAIKSIKSTYGVKKNWQGDPCVPMKYSWSGLNCSYVGNLSPPRIISLNLSSSGLTGSITESISKLKMIESLDLSNNSLSGAVPDSLALLPNLRVLNLKGNNFTGSIPTALLEKSKTGSLLLSYGDDNSSSEKTKKSGKSIVIPIVASIGGLVILLSIAGLIVFVLRKKNRQGGASSTITAVNNNNNNNNVEASIESETRNRQFSYSDVIKMTNNFERILGKGGFGTVYYGFITDGSTPVAVKILSASSAQGLQEFQAEVKLLLRVHHRNLTSLVGYCNEGTNKALIYEYMAKGNLDSHLSPKNTSVLSWEGRLQIAIDAAQGITYVIYPLHNGCKPPIVHRDVKTSNILLAENFQAKLADFGLSKAFPTDGGTHVSTVVAGTPGYLDPEYYLTNRLNEKSDVYSFGVVLLQIITSKTAIISTSHHERTSLSKWVSSVIENGDIKSVVDPRLNGDFEVQSVWRAVELSMACVSESPSKRPNMNQVVNGLNECLTTEQTWRNNNSRTMDAINSASSTTIMADINPMAR